MIPAVCATKVCTGCGEEKALAEFPFRASEGRHRSRCKPCWNAGTTKYKKDNREAHNAYMRDRRRRNPFKYRYNLRKLGVTEEWWRRQWELQAGRCPGCLDPLEEWPNVDHDHETGELRGLLCGPCNRAIGQARECADTLRRLADYLNAKGK